MFAGSKNRAPLAGLAIVTVGALLDAGQLRTSLSTFSRPFEPTRPCKLERTSTLARIAAFSCDIVSSHVASIRAAAPDTCGAAIDVPTPLPYEFPGSVDGMLLPGAPMSTVFAPKFEKDASPSFSSVAATEMMLASGRLAG